MRIIETLSRLAVWKRNPYAQRRIAMPGIARPGLRQMELERVHKVRRELTDQFRLSMITMLGSAFAFVTALFWNDAMKEAITLIVPAEKTLIYKFIAAILVTAMAVLILFVASKLMKKEVGLVKN